MILGEAFGIGLEVLDKWILGKIIFRQAQENEDETVGLLLSRPFSMDLELTHLAGFIGGSLPDRNQVIA